MNPKCGKCSKTVYPTEELKCLDKVWHKACFKCTVCGMTLNMKNYKGYEKMPYCNAHYPTTKHTVVADTPENRRIAENTKIQSAIQYHSEYEQTKSLINCITNTPEMRTHLKNSQNFSLVKYHEDFERQKGLKTSVADDPETARIRQNTANQSNVNYWGVREQRNVMESKRPNEQVDEVMARRQPGKISDYDPAVDAPSPYSQRSSANVVYDSQKGGMGEIRPQGSSSGQRSSTHSYAPFSYGGPSAGTASTSSPSPSYSPSSANQPGNYNYRNSGGSSGRNSYGDPSPSSSSSTQYGSGGNRTSGGGYGVDPSHIHQQQNRSSYGGQPQQQQQQNDYNHQRPYSYGNPQGNMPQPQQHPQQPAGYGSHHHHQQTNSPRNSSGYASRDSNSHSYSGGGGGGGGSYQQEQQQRSSTGHYPPPQIQGHRVQPGSIADYDPMNDRHSSSSMANQSGGGGGGYQQQPPMKQQQPPMKQQQPPQQQYQPPPQPQMPPPQQKQAPVQGRYKAIYDYVAADDDEVSFVEGDMIGNCEIIDEGWMTGVVLRTGQHGMLPSNYVEQC